MFKDLGIPRGNQNGAPDSSLKLTACNPCTTSVACQDVYVGPYDSALEVKGIEFNGVVITFLNQIKWSELEALYNEISAAILAKEINPEFQLNVDGESLAVSHSGHLAFTKIILSDDTSIDFVRYCDQGEVCKYQTNLVGDGNVVNIGDPAAAVALPGDYVYDNISPINNAATAEALKADFEAALDAAAIDYNEIDASVNDAVGGYTLSYTGPKGTNIFIGSKEFEECLCWTAFVNDAGFSV